MCLETVYQVLSSPRDTLQECPHETRRRVQGRTTQSAMRKARGMFARSRSLWEGDIQAETQSVRPATHAESQGMKLAHGKYVSPRH